MKCDTCQQLYTLIDKSALKVFSNQEEPQAAPAPPPSPKQVRKYTERSSIFWLTTRLMCSHFTLHDVIISSERIHNDISTTPPLQIHAYLDRFVIGQEHSKRVLAVQVYAHYNRIHHNQALLAANDESQTHNAPPGTAVNQSSKTPFTGVGGSARHFPDGLSGPQGPAGSTTDRLHTSGGFPGLIVPNSSSSGGTSVSGENSLSSCLSSPLFCN